MENDRKQSLAERFALEPMSVGIGGRQLEIFGIGNWDRIVATLAQQFAALALVQDLIRSGVILDAVEKAVGRVR